MTIQREANEQRLYTWILQKIVDSDKRQLQIHDFFLKATKSLIILIQLRKIIFTNLNAKQTLK